MASFTTGQRTTTYMIKLVQFEKYAEIYKIDGSRKMTEHTRKKTSGISDWYGTKSQAILNMTVKLNSLQHFVAALGTNPGITK